MSFINKVFLCILGISLLSLCFFIYLWKTTSEKLEISNKKLCDANSTIDLLQKEHEKLLQYTHEKENALKEIEKEYSEVLKNIPKDACGDVIPSKVLLEYFRNNI